MADAEHVTLAFLDAHPAEAARVLQALPTGQAATLFETISPRLGGPVVAAMLPPAAARIIGRLSNELALPLLSAAGAQASVGILRHTAEPARSRLLASLPAVASLATQILLGFPEDAVGAWTDPDVVALLPGLSAHEALQALRASEAPDVEAIYVVDALQRLQGEIALPALVRAPDSSPIDQLMRPSPATLAPMMPIAAAAASGAWIRSGAVPVVDHDKRLLGVLRRARLAQAVRSRARPAQEPTDGASVSGVLAGGYWTIVSGLAGAALVLLPPVRRVRPGDP